MAFYDKFPYTNFQELNLDWLTQEVSKVRDNRDATDASAAAALASEQAAKASETAAAASQQAAAKSETAAAGSEAASAEYLAQIGTNTAGVVADWLNENIKPTTPAVDASLKVSGAAADAKVTGDKISEANDNFTSLYDIHFEDGKIIMHNDIYESASYAISDFFPVSAGQKVRCITQMSADTMQVAFFDANKKVVQISDGVYAAYDRTQAQSSEGNVYTFSLTAPEGASYFSFCTGVQGKQKCSFICFGIIPEMSATKLKIGKTLDNSSVYADSLIDGKFIMGSTGNEAETPGYKCTPFIELPFDDVSEIQLKSTIYDRCGCAFYDEDKSFILGINGDNITQYGGKSILPPQILNIPREAIKNAKYARLSAGPNKIENASELWVSGKEIAGAFRHIFKMENDLHTINSLLPTTIANSKVLVIGDSISTDYYGNYKKWVTDLINEGFLPIDTNNDSMHATGFVARYNNEPNDFITRLKAVENPSQYDLVVVFGGINDYIQNVPMGSESGSDYTVSFKPAVNEFFTYLINNFTQARLCVILPLRTYATWKNTAEEYQQAYGNYIKQVAKSYCLPVLNLTEDSGFYPFVNKFSDLWTLHPQGFESSDGVHPNEEYQRKFLAPMIKHFLQGMM